VRSEIKAIYINTHGVVYGNANLSAWFSRSGDSVRGITI